MTNQTRKLKENQKPLKWYKNMSAANNPKNIYCVGSELNDTFSNF